MSVDYSAGLVSGWKITKEQYDRLPSPVQEDYCYYTNAYNESYGDIIFGDYHMSLDPGTAEAVPDTVGVSLETALLFDRYLHDEFVNVPPALYLYCRVS